MGAALDFVAPVTTSLKAVEVGPITPRRRALRALGRVIAVAVGVGVVIGIFWMGRQLIMTAPTAEDAVDPTLEEVLTSPARPLEQFETGDFASSFPVAGFRSYDPFNRRLSSSQTRHSSSHA